MRIGITFDYKAAGIKAAQNGLKALAKTALGTSLSVAGAATAISRMVRSAADNQRAFANLGQTMQNLGFVGAEHQARDLFNQLELQHGIVTSELLPAYRTLFNSLGNVQGTQKTLNAAIKTSIGSGRNLADVSSALAKAYLGQTSAISKLNIGLTKAELSSMSFDKILTKLENKFGGAAATNAEQFATKMDRVKLAINQAKDAIGEGFIFAIEESGRRSGRTVDDITNKIVTLGERTSQYIRLISLRWNETSSTVEQSWLGKLLDDVRYNNPTFLGKLFELGAVGLKLFNEEAKKLQDPFANYLPSTRADRMTADKMAMVSFQRTQYIMEQARLREERAKKRTAAAEAAQKRAEAAQRKRDQALAMKYDIERAGLNAALMKANDADTKQRLRDLLTLNQDNYSEWANSATVTAQIAANVNSTATAQAAATAAASSYSSTIQKAADSTMSMAQAMKTLEVTGLGLQGVLGGLARLQEQVADRLKQQQLAAQAATVATAISSNPTIAAYLAGQGPTDESSQFAAMRAMVMRASLAAGGLSSNQFWDAVRQAEFESALPSGGYQPLTPDRAAQIVVNVQAAGSIIAQQDLQQVVADAVNQAARSGASLAPVGSRL